MESKWSNLSYVMAILAFVICIIFAKRKNDAQQEELKKVETRETVQAEVVSRETIEPEVVADTPEIVQEEGPKPEYDSLDILARCVEAEAGNQSLEGRRYVVSTILNRVNNSDYPDTIEGVIKQPYQFSTWWNGAIDRAQVDETTLQAIQIELEQGQINTEVFYFRAGRFSDYGTPFAKIGDHYFSYR